LWLKKKELSDFVDEVDDTNRLNEIIIRINKKILAMKTSFSNEFNSLEVFIGIFLE
jgi:hypothetical protein